MRTGHFSVCLTVGVWFLSSGWALGASPQDVPPEVVALCRSAEQFQNAGLIEQAQADYQRIIESFPNTPFAAEAFSKILVLQIQADRIEEAQKMLPSFWQNYASQPNFV